MLKLGDKLKLGRVTPHIPRMLGGAEATGLCGRSLLRLMPPGRRKAITHIVCMEKLDCSLRDAITTHGIVSSDAQLRCVAFQVLFTLAALTHLIPGLRHNDLSCHNVLVRRLPRPRASYYIVPGIGMVRCVSNVRTCIADFDFCHAASCPFLHNQRVLSRRYSVRDDANATYDTNLFLFSLRQSLAASASTTTTTTTTCAWLASLPICDSPRASAPVPGLEPLTLLRGPFFASMRVRSTPAKKMAAYRILTCRQLFDVSSVIRRASRARRGLLVVDGRRGSPSSRRRGRRRCRGIRLANHRPGRMVLRL